LRLDRWILREVLGYDGNSIDELIQIGAAEE
jgi:hypothetical protein